MKPTVPEGMLKVACLAWPDIRTDYVDNDNYGVFTRPILEAALEWLDKRLEEMDEEEPFDRDLQIDRVRDLWRTPSTEMPEEIADLFVKSRDQTLRCTIFEANQRLIEAFRRGQRSKETK